MNTETPLIEAVVRIAAPLAYAAAVPLLFMHSPGNMLILAAALPVILLAADLAPLRGARSSPRRLRHLAAVFAIVGYTALICWGVAVADGRNVLPLAVAAGLGAGVFGILAAHEMIHSRARLERLFGAVMLTAVTYRHFRTSHIHGHHRWAGTRKDPTTAPRDCSAYRFIAGSIVRQLRDCWAEPCWRKCLLQDAVLYLALYGCVGAAFGRTAVVFLAMQSLVAIVVLELFNYVAHYGLLRRFSGGRIESLSHIHCWNARGELGNWLLLDMGRHYEHHRRTPAAGSPVLPGGFAGAILLALVPPLWRKVMNPRIDECLAGATAQPPQRRGDACAVLGLVVLLLGGCGSSRIAPVVAGEPPEAGDSEAAKHGAYLVAVANCIGCHTDKKHRGQPFAGGGEVVTPFGIYYSRNITPDRAHGIGAWSDQAFVRALRRGIAPSGEYYFPAFPFTSFTGMTDRDMLDIKAYLMTQKSETNANKPPSVSFPYSSRSAVGLWRMLYFKQGPLTPDPGKSAEWNRGNYLVNAVGHCAECHTRRNKLGALDNGKRFAGGKMETPGGVVIPNFATRVPNITPDLADGIGRWSAADIEKLLQIGQRPNGDFIAAPMSEVVEGTSKLTPADRRAMAVYLKSLPALPGRGG